MGPIVVLVLVLLLLLIARRREKKAEFIALEKFYFSTKSTYSYWGKSNSTTLYLLHMLRYILLLVHSGSSATVSRGGIGCVRYS